MAEPIPEKEIEGAYELPEGWVWAKLSDIIEPSKEKMQPPFNETEKYIGLEHIGSNTGQIVGIGRGTDVKSTKNRFYKGDVLYGKLRPYLNKTVIMDFNGICSTDLIVFRRSDFLENKYLMRFLSTQHVVSFANQNMTGVQHPRISFDRLGQILFPLPPLTEQCRITAKLEALLAQVNAAKYHLAAVPPIITRFRQSVLAAACSGRLTEDWRRGHPDVEPASELLKRIREERIRRYEEEFQKPKAEGRRKPKKPKNIEPREVETGGLPELPDGWAWAVFDQIAKAENNAIKAGPFGSSLKKEIYVTEGYKIYGQEQVIRGDPYYGDYYIDEEKYNELITCSVQPDDLLISLVGTIGKTLILPSDIEPGIINPRLVKISLDDKIGFNEYIQTYLNSNSAEKFYEISSHGGTMEILNLKILRALPIPLPPLSEQRAIVNRIEALFHRTSEVEERVAAATSHADRLTQSILAKAFRGELVPQDPDDEPASVLLERIRKERTELKKKKKPQKRRSKTLPDSN